MRVYTYIYARFGCCVHENGKPKFNFHKQKGKNQRIKRRRTEKEQEKESGRERERKREIDERFDREKFKSFHFLANKQRFFFWVLSYYFSFA